MIPDNLDHRFDPTMRPYNPVAARMMKQVGRWIVAELHERGVQTDGFGKVDPRWRLTKMTYALEDMRRWLTEERLKYMLARVFFYGKPRDEMDASLCEICATLAKVYGLIGATGD